MGRLARQGAREPGRRRDQAIRIVRAAPQQVSHPERRAAAEGAAREELVDEEVHVGDAAWTGAVQPEEAQHRPLDRHGRAPLQRAEHLGGDPVGERVAALDHGEVELEVGDDASVGEPHGQSVGPDAFPRKDSDVAYSPGTRRSVRRRQRAARSGSPRRLARWRGASRPARAPVRRSRRRRSSARARPRAWCRAPRARRRARPRPRARGRRARPRSRARLAPTFPFPRESIRNGPARRDDDP